MNAIQLSGELRRVIYEHLHDCDPAHTPGICSGIQSPKDYRRIESQIIALVAAEGISVGAAITAIETELES